MLPSYTISFYIVRNLFVNLLYVFSIFSLIAFIIDFLELIRDSQGKSVFIGQIFTMALCKLPFLVFAFFPFIFLFGAIMTFTKLNNNLEISAIRSAGVSVLSLCIPISLGVILLSLIITWVWQPISTVFLEQNRLMGVKYLGYNAKRLSLQSKNIWLHDQTIIAEDEKFIKLDHVESNSKLLSGVSVYAAGKNLDFTTSYVAENGYLEDGKLILNKLYKYEPSKAVQYFDNVVLTTSLLVNQIQESIPNPDIIPLYKLQDLIQLIKKSGLSSLKHELYYKSMLYSPLMYMALTFIALVCSMQLPRNSKVGVVFIVGGVIGLLVFFLNKVINIMALTGVMPMNFAVIAPGVSYLLLSLAALIHLEEG
jgi:lipopolysaccharide export system permease protein